MINMIKSFKRMSYCLIGALVISMVLNIFVLYRFWSLERLLVETKLTETAGVAKLISTMETCMRAFGLQANQTKPDSMEKVKLGLK